MDATKMSLEKQAETLQLISFLESYLPALGSRIPTKINEGGCGIFALHLAETLEIMGFEPKLTYFTDEKEEKLLEEGYSNKGNFDDNAGLQHCLVGITDYIFFDSSGVQLPPKFQARASNCDTHREADVVAMEITKENLKLINAHIGSWNPVFDRECEPKIIEELSKMPKDWEEFKAGRLDLDRDIKLNFGTKFSKNTIEAMKKQSHGGFSLADLLGGGE